MKYSTRLRSIFIVSLALVLMLGVIPAAYADDGIIDNTATDAYEDDNSAETASVFLLDGTIQYHNFGYEGDEDWVAFTAHVGVLYAFIARPEEGSPTQPRIAIYGSENTEIPLLRSRRQADGSALLLWSASTEGTFTLQITETNGEGNSLFMYTLQADEFYKAIGLPYPLRLAHRRT